MNELHIDPPSNELLQKEQDLLSKLASYGSVAVAFSGGVDSTYLCAVAFEALGDNALAVTAVSPALSQAEKEDARALSALLGIRHEIVTISDELNSVFAQNPPDRCYHCKRAIMSKLIDCAHAHCCTTVIEASNSDDGSDYRPGMRAVKELGIKSPLAELAFTKNEIRALSKRRDLPTWNKPSLACLASRVPYGSPITQQKLRMIENAENLLRARGFPLVRVRHHGDVARIELPPEDMARLLQPQTAQAVYEAMRALGFTYTALDLIGLRSGSMNEALSPDQKSNSTI